MKYVCHGCVLMLEWFRRRRRTGLIPVHHGSKNVLKRGNWDLLIAVFFNAAAQLYWSVNPFVNMHYIIKLCYGVQCAVCPSTTRCRQWYTCLHALTHCIRWHPLIHRSSDTLSSLTRKNTLQTHGHCTRTDSLLLSKFLILSSRWQLRSLTSSRCVKREEENSSNPCRTEQRKGDESIAITFHTHRSPVQGKYI